MLSEVRDEQPDQQLLEGWRFVVIAEVCFHHLPERLAEIELFDLFPSWRRDVEVEHVAVLGIGMKQRADDVEELRQLGLHHNGQQLPIEVRRDVFGGNQRLELLQPFLAVEELAAVGEVLPQVLILQAEFIQQDRRAIGSEAAAIEPNVEQPIAFILRLFGGRVQQILASRVVPFQTNLGFQRRDLVEPQQRHTIEQYKRQRVLKLLVRVIPKHDPRLFLVEELFQCRVDLIQVAHRVSPKPRVEKKLHSMYSFMQSSGASKSGAIYRMLPFAKPGPGRGSNLAGSLTSITSLATVS